MKLKEYLSINLSLFVHIYLLIWPSMLKMTPKSRKSHHSQPAGWEGGVCTRNIKQQIYSPVIWRSFCLYASFLSPSLFLSLTLTGPGTHTYTDTHTHTHTHENINCYLISSCLLHYKKYFRKLYFVKYMQRLEMKPTWGDEISIYLSLYPNLLWKESLWCSS